MKNFLKISPKAFKYSLLLAVICSVFLSFAHFNAACDDLRENVLRLHIIANSDRNFDQQLKLKIRDAILEDSKDLFNETHNINQAVETVSNNTQRIEDIAENVIVKSGYNYPVNVSVKNSYFETRVYENFTLPAGEYPSLIIKVGEGKGKNWWCVIFPEVCIPTSLNGSLSDSVTDTGCEIAENPQRYIMRFKIVEIYENIKKLFHF